MRELPADVRQTLEELAEIRGLDPPPEIRAEVISRSELPALLERLTTDEERRDLAETTTLYRLLGHLRPDQDLLELQEALSEFVLGFYLTTEKTLWVVHDGEGLDTLDELGRATLVHELVHLLQDHHFDLEATADRIGDSPDGQLAFSAVVEGDAELHTSRFFRSVRTGASGGWFFLRAAALQSDALGELSMTLLREIGFPYSEGEAWVAEVVAEDGVEAINAFLTEPPPATTLIIHPELMGTGWAPEEVALPAIASALGEGWRLEAEGVFGEFHLDNYLLALALNREEGDDSDLADDREAASAGWAGDRYAVYVSEDGAESVFVARVRFVDEDEAEEFAQLQLTLTQAERPEAGTVTIAANPEQGTFTALTAPVGREALFAIGTSEAAARAALEALIGG